MFKRISLCLLLILLTGSVVFSQTTDVNVGDTELLWVHNFQFFQYDYKIGATVVAQGENSNIWVENSLVTAILVDEANSVVYAGTKKSGIFKKALSETQWTAITDGFPGNSRSVTEGLSKVNDLLLTSDGTLLAGLDDGMYRWEESGARWRRATISDPVFCILEAGDLLYAGIGGYVWSDDSDEDGDIDIDMGIFISDNGGAAWNRSTNGIATDNDDEHMAVFDLEKTNGSVLATTDAGVFQSDNGGAFWYGVERTIVASQANIKVNLQESTQDEETLRELDASLGPLYERLLTVDGISREDKVIVVEYDSLGQVIHRWNCPEYDLLVTEPSNKVTIKPGIVGDEGKWTLKLSFYTRGEINPDFILDYTALDINDFQYRGEPATATIIDPETELLLLVSYPDDANFEVGGKFINVKYSDGNNEWVWSVKANTLRGLNNEKKGVLLNNDHLVLGDPIDNYDQLNYPDIISQMELSTASGLVLKDLAYSDTDQVIYASSDNGVYASSDLGKSWQLVGSVTEGLENIDIQCMKLKDGALYVGTLDNIFKSTTGGTSWTSLGLIESQTQIYAMDVSGSNVYAGTLYGFFETADEGGTWNSPNLGMQVYADAEDVANVLASFEESTPNNASKGIYMTITDQFGVENVPDTDHNSRVDVLLHEIFEKGRLEDLTSNGNFGTSKMTGYFRPEDQNMIGNTNRHDFIYIDSGETTVAERNAAMAHQLMRMIIWNSDYDEERWVSEGIAFMGEKLCGYRLPTGMPNFKSLTGAPTVFSLVAGTPLSPWAVSPQDGDITNRFTMSSLFSTFLFENFGGIDLFNDIIDEPANGWIGIQNVFMAQNSSLRFDDVYAAWAMATTINDTDQNDPITGARYGYQDSLYSAVLERNKDDYTLAMNSLAIFGHNQDLSIYDTYSRWGEVSNGLNNWAFVIRYLFPTPNLEESDPDSAIKDSWYKDKDRTDPETGEFLPIDLKVNAVDNTNLRVQLIKMTPEGEFDVENITPMFNDEKELSFNVFSKFEPGDDNRTLKYHKMWIMISNQDSLGRAAKLTITKDTTPPKVQYQLVHNPIYPEFVDIMVHSDERTFYDVGADLENPTVDMVYFTDTTDVNMELFDEIQSIGNMQEYFIYKGRYHLVEEGQVTLVIRKLQDLSGNDTETITSTLSVRKAVPNSTSTLVTPNKNATLRVPEDAVSSETFMTAYSEKSKEQAGLKKGKGIVFCSDIYNFGPINKTLNNPATLTIKYDKDKVTESTGLFKLENNKWVAVPAAVNPKNSTYTASVSQLGVYALLAGDQIQSENIDPVELPTTFAVYQNYPNPFNPVTEIKYELPNQEHVKMTIYNMQGQLVQNLVDQNLEAGYHTVRWDGTNNIGQRVSSGVYFYRIEAGSFNETKKMILIK